MKKFTELFTRMFHDPNQKVVIAFLVTLSSFILTHAADIPIEWLYVCLSRLLERTSADLLKSVSNKLQSALKAVK